MTATIKVLVTGTEGQLARSLDERARLNPRFEVVRLGRPALDLERPDTIERAIKQVMPDVVVSAAAFTAVDLAEDQATTAHAINVTAAGRLSAAARAIGAPIIHISTDYVFDGSKPDPYVETDAVNPQSVYGRTKLDGERMVAAENPNHIILRTSWVYSPFGRNFVKTMLQLAETREQLTVVGDQFGNPTSALDLADAILSILISKPRHPGAGRGQVYHCAGSGEASWSDLAQHTLDVSRSLGGAHATVVPIQSSAWPAKARRPMNSRLNCDKLSADLGWRAPDWRLSTADVVKRLIAAKAQAA